MKIRSSLLAPLQAAAFLVLALLLAALTHAEPAAAGMDALMEQARALALQSARPPPGSRTDVEVGSLDARLKLAPCDKAEAYLPAGFKAWGRTRIGLRCVQGAVRWNVFMPVTVKVFGSALVAANNLSAGSVLAAADLARGEVDLAADAQPAMTDATLLIGRTLTRALNAGDSLRQNAIRPRQYFAAGESVQLIASGDGYAVETEGQAMGPGIEGSAVRVRVDSGRIVSGMPVGARRVEMTL